MLSLPNMWEEEQSLDYLVIDHLLKFMLLHQMGIYVINNYLIYVENRVEVFSLDTC